MQIPDKRGVGSVRPVSIGLPSTKPPAAAGEGSRCVDDSVSLSSAARERQAAATHPRFGYHSVQAHADPKLAEQLAHDYAHNEQSPIIDLTDLQSGRGPAKYAATGEPVTPESEGRYKRMAESLRSASLALYRAEKVKGTGDADIFDKLIAMVDAQPAEFRNIIDWEGKTVEQG